MTQTQIGLFQRLALVVLADMLVLGIAACMHAPDSIFIRIAEIGQIAGERPRVRAEFSTQKLSIGNFENFSLFLSPLYSHPCK